MMNLLIVMQDLWTALDIMWKGVLAIAIVIALVIAVTTVVNKVCVSVEKSPLSKKRRRKTKTANSNACQFGAYCHSERKRRIPRGKVNSRFRSVNRQRL